MRSSNDVFSSADALRFGWATTRANLKPLLMIGVVAALLALLQRALASPGGDYLRLLMATAVQILQVGVVMVWIRAALRLHDGEPLERSKLVGSLDELFTFVLTVVLLGLVMAVGFVLLVVPGVVWGLKYGFSTFAVLDRKLDPLAAFRESARITDGMKGRLFTFALLVMGVNLLGALALGIGLLVTVPTTCIAAAQVFRKLQARAARDLREAPLPHIEPTPTGA